MRGSYKGNFLIRFIKEYMHLMKNCGFTKTSDLLKRDFKKKNVVSPREINAFKLFSPLYKVLTIIAGIKNYPS